MKQLYLGLGIFIVLALSSCSISHTNNHPTTVSQLKKVQLEKDPMAVAFYPKGKAPAHPYKVIAKETVSKFNAGGIKRQKATLHDVLSQLAASVGGDAIINVKQDNQKISGEVVKFKV